MSDGQQNELRPIISWMNASPIYYSEEDPEFVAADNPGSPDFDTENGNPATQIKHQVNSFSYPKWDMGIVDAGNSSHPIHLLIWNNRNGLTDVSDMQDVKLITTDNEEDNSDVVKYKWVKALDTTDPSVPINNENEVKIGGNCGLIRDLHGLVPTEDEPQVETCPEEAFIREALDLTALGMPAGTIGGKANNGELTYRADGAQEDTNPNNKNNYVSVRLRTIPPMNATAGKKEFKIRVSYYYT